MTEAIKIKNRLTGAVLYEFMPTDEQQSSGLALRAALEVRGADLSDADLSDADLRDADLRGADLSGADLSGADLRGADLSGADLRGAELSGADLSDADLSGANLSGAELSGADLRGAVLSDADLRVADLSVADLRGADLSGADLRDADLRGAELSGADLSGADLSDAVLSDAASPEESVANLDKVREIIIDRQERLHMGHWHATDEWKQRTCAEEMLCGTTHCLAGWLQVCSTDEKIRGMDTLAAGILSAPIAAKMFYRDNAEALAWLKDRKYVDDLAERERRDTERKAKKEASE